MRKHPQVICEIANSHGGKLNSLIKTIKSFSNINYPDLSIKFQIFSAQGLSVKNFFMLIIFIKNFVLMR